MRPQVSRDDKLQLPVNPFAPAAAAHIAATVAPRRAGVQRLVRRKEAPGQALEADARPRPQRSRPLRVEVVLWMPPVRLRCDDVHTTVVHSPSP